MRMIRRFAALVGFAAFAGMVSASSPPTPPTEIAGSPASPLALVGEARLTKYMFHIYDARLWAAEGRYDASRPHALEIRYARRIAADALTTRTIEEWRRLGLWDAAREQRWRAVLGRAWPDVEPGDRLLAYIEPGKPMRIFHNGQPYSEFDDPEFASAFFAIWLDPRTSEPKLRKKLLGLARR